MDFYDVLQLTDEELAAYAESLSTEDLEALKMQFQTHVDSLNAKRLVLNPIMDLRQEEASAKKVYDGLTDAQKTALAQFIKVDPIINQRIVNGTE